jgi:hypothetical protein
LLEWRIVSGDSDPKFLGIENLLINTISLRDFSFRQSTFRFPS